MRVVGIKHYDITYSAPSRHYNFIVKRRVVVGKKKKKIRTNELNSDRRSCVRNIITRHCR